MWRFSYRAGALLHWEEASKWLAKPLGSQGSQSQRENVKSVLVSLFGQYEKSELLFHGGWRTEREAQKNT